MIDYHIHTDHSGDGRTPLEVMVDAAIAKGLEEICITSHYDEDAPTGGMMDFDLDFSAYVPEVQRLAHRHRERIAIKLGVEAGFQAGKPKAIDIAAQNIARHPFDFVIASTHFMPKPDYHHEANWRGTSRTEVQAGYLNHTLSYMERFIDFDVLAHLTYYSRYSPSASRAEREMTYADNAALYDELFDRLIKLGKGIEINTSTFVPFGFFMPDFTIARRFRELGGEIITIGSDAHVPAHIGRHYDRAVAMLREAGFKAICTFERRTPRFVGI